MKKIGTKLIFTLVVLVIVLVLNNIFGFSYYYNSDKKINQIKEISLILTNEKILIETKSKLEKIGEDLLSRKDIFQYISSLRLSKNVSKSKFKYINSSRHLILF